MKMGPGVRGLTVGDHVVASFLAACGRCRWCATGQQNLCDLGSIVLYGTQVDDDDVPLSRACLVGCAITTGWGSAVNTAKVAVASAVA